MAMGFVEPGCATAAGKIENLLPLILFAYISMISMRSTLASLPLFSASLVSSFAKSKSTAGILSDWK
jgi:hypothetical protein